MTDTTLVPGPSLDKHAGPLHEARAVVDPQLREVVPSNDVVGLDRPLPLQDGAVLNPHRRAVPRRGDIGAMTGLPLPADARAPDTAIDDAARALAWHALVNRWRVTIRVRGRGRLRDARDRRLARRSRRDRRRG